MPIRLVYPAVDGYYYIIMTRTCWILFFILFTQGLSAQEYQPFLPGKAHTFLSGNDLETVVATQDSLLSNLFHFNRTTVLADTFLYSFGYQYYFDEPGPFGNRMEVPAPGLYWTIGDGGDTLFLDSQAPVGFPWQFLSDSNLTAEITSRSLATLNGITDSLLTIDISDGNSIVLSKEHGLISSPNFAYYLRGESYLGMDLFRDPNLNTLEVYFNWSVGTFFHYFINDDDIDAKERDVFYKVLDKQINPARDTIFYTMAYYLRPTYPGGYYTEIRDTLDIFYALEDCAHFQMGSPTIVSGPLNQPYVWNTRELILSPHHGRPAIFLENYQVHNDGFLYQNPNDVSQIRLHYEEGLGLTSETISSVVFQYSFHQRLVCYKTDDDSSGVCEDVFPTLGTGGQGAVSDSSAFAVWPNPVSDQLFIQSMDANSNPLRVVLYDSQGRTVFLQEGFLPGNEHIDVSRFSKGIYLLKVGNEENREGVYRIWVR